MSNATTGYPRGGRCSALIAVKRYICTEKSQLTLQVYICLSREQNTESETGRDGYGPTHHSRLKYQTAYVLTAPLLCATASLTLLSLHHVQNPLVIVTLLLPSTQSHAFLERCSVSNPLQSVKHC